MLSYLCKKYNNDFKFIPLIYLIILFCIMLTINITIIGNKILCYIPGNYSSCEVNKNSKIYKFFNNNIVIMTEIVLVLLLLFLNYRCKKKYNIKNNVMKLFI